MDSMSAPPFPSPPPRRPSKASTLKSWVTTTGVMATGVGRVVLQAQGVAHEERVLVGQLSADLHGHGAHGLHVADGQPDCRKPRPRPAVMVFFPE